MTEVKIWPENAHAGDARSGSCCVMAGANDTRHGRRNTKQQKRITEMYLIRVVQ